MVIARRNAWNEHLENYPKQVNENPPKRWKRHSTSIEIDEKVGKNKLKAQNKSKKKKKEELNILLAFWKS